MKSIIVLCLLFVFTVSAASSDSDSKIARYLKSCGIITSLKVSKCAKKTGEVDNELKAFAKSDDKRNFSKIKASCKEATDCIKDLKCKALEEDHKETLEFCGRVLFTDEFKECTQKLVALKKNDKVAGKCLEKFQSDANNSPKDACAFLKESKDCIQTHIKKECGEDILKRWQSFSQEILKGTACEKII